MTIRKEMEEHTLSKSIITDGESILTLAFAESESASAFLISDSEGGIISSTNLTSFDSKILPETAKHGHHITGLIGIPLPIDTDDSRSCVDRYVSGCKDATIQMFDGSHKLVRTLKGHNKTVTSLSWLRFSKRSNILISGIWDGTAKLWDISNRKCLTTMDGHENTVSVQGLPPTADANDNIDSMGRFVTGSAGIAAKNLITGHKIRLYKVTLTTDNTLSLTTTLANTTPNDHTGPIRSLAFDTVTAMILSFSDDRTVKVRDSHSGECVLVLRTAPLHSNQQPPMILDVISLGPGKIVACSEDRNAFLWDILNNKDDDQTQSPQIISHPNCVWKVEALPNGDLVTA